MGSDVSVQGIAEENRRGNQPQAGATAKPEPLEIFREGKLADRVVIVDGLGGCGKTLISPLVAALDRVEKLTYAYDLEYVCTLLHLKKIETDAAIAFIRIITDQALYNTMMSRDVNFRPGDLSSVFCDAHPLRYFKRLFQKGDEEVPARISEERPILHLTTHHNLGMGEPIFRALGDRLLFIEVVRHPLYMIKQMMINMEIHTSDRRNFDIYFLYGGKTLPFYAAGWEDRFVRSGPMDRAIYIIDHFTTLTETAKQTPLQKYAAQIYTLPFESFCLTPHPYLQEISQKLGTRMNASTRRAMRRQNVPRNRYADGIDLPIYKHFGWRPAQSNSDEAVELNIRRKFAEQHATPDAMSVLDSLCRQYEEKYM